MPMPILIVPFRRLSGGPAEIVGGLWWTLSVTGLLLDSYY